jgi:uncharacterized membrane protein YobD (UPF0266 family)
MNSTPLDSSFQCASFEPKKFYLAFFVYEKFTKNQKTQIFAYFWLPHQQIGSMNSTPLDSSFQCASFEPKKFYLAFFVYEKFTKNQKTQIFAYFWLPHQQIGSMNSTPLDSSFQCASFEPKKFYLAFFL